MCRFPRFYAPAPAKGIHLLAVGLCCLVFAACGRGDFSGLEALPVDDYLERPRNLLGNTYLISAQIESQIEWEEGVGRILAVDTEGADSRVPVFVPEGVGENLYVGQRYEMRASIRRGGLIYVENLRKF
jgi:hypothetical protein